VPWLRCISGLLSFSQRIPGVGRPSAGHSRTTVLPRIVHCSSWNSISVDHLGGPLVCRRPLVRTVTTVHYFIGLQVYNQRTKQQGPQQSCRCESKNFQTKMHADKKCLNISSIFRVKRLFHTKSHFRDLLQTRAAWSICHTWAKRVSLTYSFIYGRQLWEGGDFLVCKIHTSGCQVFTFGSSYERPPVSLYQLSIVSMFQKHIVVMTEHMNCRCET